MKHILSSVLILLIFLTGCRNKSGVKTSEIIIFHAGSLSVPLKQFSDEYEN
jgi:ABC-type molybdate transport system substrate-binding protein